MDKKENKKKDQKKPELKPKINFAPQSFTGGRSFKPNASKGGGFNPGSFKTQHKG